MIGDGGDGDGGGCEGGAGSGPGCGSGCGSSCSLLVIVAVLFEGDDIIRSLGNELNIIWSSGDELRALIMLSMASSLLFSSLLFSLSFGDAGDVGECCEDGASTVGEYGSCALLMALVMRCMIARVSLSTIVVVVVVVVVAVVIVVVGCVRCGDEAGDVGDCMGSSSVYTLLVLNPSMMRYMTERDAGDVGELLLLASSSFPSSSSSSSALSSWLLSLLLLLCLLML